MKRKIAALLGTTVTAISLLAGCGNQKAQEQQAAEEVANALAEAVEDAMVEEAVGEAVGEAVAEALDPTTVDYSAIDIEIAYGDSDAASELASNMWYGEYDGKVVKIDGIAEKLGSWSIMEEAGEGSKVGFGFELVDSEDYPVDGTRVELVGVIAPGGTMEGARVLYVLPENMTPIS